MVAPTLRPNERKYDPKTGTKGSAKSSAARVKVPDAGLNALPLENTRSHDLLGGRGDVCNISAKLWAAIACVAMFITMMFTYATCVKEKYCPALPHLPTISNTWDYPPGNFVSRFVVNNVASSLAACQFVIWVPASNTKLHEKLLLGLGVFGTFCLSIVGAICDDSKDPQCRGNNTVHSTAAVTFFVLYNFNMIVLTSKKWPSYSKIHQLVLHALTVMSLLTKIRFFPSRLGLDADNLGDQTYLAIFEWSDVFLIMGWSVYFIWALRPSARASIGPKPASTSNDDTTYGEVSSFTIAITVLVLFFGTLISCFTAAYLEGRIPHGTWPYISDLWVYPPGNWISRWGVVFGCTLSILLMLVLHYINGDDSKFGVMTTGLAIVSILGLDVVGCVNESEFPPAHFAGAIVFFVGFDVYMLLVSSKRSKVLRSSRYWITRAVLAVSSSVLSSVRLYLYLKGIISSIGAVLEWSNAFVIITYVSYSIFAHGDAAKNIVLRMSGPAPAGPTKNVLPQ